MSHWKLLKKKKKLKKGKKTYIIHQLWEMQCHTASGYILQSYKLTACSMHAPALDIGRNLQEADTFE